MPKVTGLGHVGIYTNDLMKQRDFYSRVMGLQITDEDIDGLGIVFMSARPEEEHHEFVLMKGRDAPEDAKLVQQLSFTVDSIEELKKFHRVFQEEGVNVERIVSHGNAFGMYGRDPEGNRFEVYYKTEVDVPQPHSQAIDLSQSDEELMNIARAAVQGV